MPSLRRVGGLGHTRLVSNISIIGIGVLVASPPPVSTTTACKEGKQDGDKERDGSGKYEPCGDTVRSGAAADIPVDGVSDDSEEGKVESHGCEGNEESEKDDQRGE